ncbi:hypothetical protein COO60DRAFT_1496596 [Scenedesmus sp. NREL 46B-D3]|nr:hypothetical protein COO60DRAFT_1496596 [Scenedesmus sp. NREL 46B-D3]
MTTLPRCRSAGVHSTCIALRTRARCTRSSPFTHSFIAQCQHSSMPACTHWHQCRWVESTDRQEEVAMHAIFTPARVHLYQHICCRRHCRRASKHRQLHRSAPRQGVPAVSRSWHRSHLQARSCLTPACRHWMALLLCPHQHCSAPGQGAPAVRGGWPRSQQDRQQHQHRHCHAEAVELVGAPGIQQERFLTLDRVARHLCCWVDRHGSPAGADVGAEAAAAAAAAAAVLIAAHIAVRRAAMQGECV